MTSSSRYAPRNALGIEPIISQRTRRQFTVRRRTWTLPPNGFSTSDVTTSAETAEPGLTPNNEHEHGRHQRPAAHAGQADDEADDHPGQRLVEIEVHPVVLASAAPRPRFRGRLFRTC